MTNTKDFKWLRGLHKATFRDERTDLFFEITRNPMKNNREDKFLYKCFDSNNRLVFDRKINFATAMVVINGWSEDGWNGEAQIQELASK